MDVSRPVRVIGQGLLHRCYGCSETDAMSQKLLLATSCCRAMGAGKFGDLALNEGSIED